MTSTPSSSLPPTLTYMGRTGIILMAVYFLLIGILLIQNVILIWPTAVQPLTKQAFKKVSATEIKTDQAGNKDTISYNLELPYDTSYLPKEPLKLKFYFWHLAEKESKDSTTQTPSVQNSTPKLKEGQEGISLEMRFILMTLLIGALGSWLHAVSSFVAFVGNRNFVMSWVPWYIMRPFIGGVLALIFYMVLRAGLLPVNVGGEVPVSPYSVAAFAGLVGLFAQRATLKLAEVFDVIFSSTANYKDSLNKKLALTKLVPDNLQVNTTQLEVNVEGNGFSDPMKVFVKGQVRQSTYKNKNLIAATLASDDVKEVGKLEVLVENSSGERSNALTLDIVSVPPSSPPSPSGI